MKRVLLAGLKIIALLVTGAALLHIGVGASRFRANEDQARACAALVSLRLDHAQILGARAISAGFEVQPLLAFVGVPWLHLPATCRVTGVSKPAAGSNIAFEVWLPAPAAWNGRLHGAGNGGFAGSIERNSLANAVQRNYAAASTDTGHAAVVSDGSWALGHPERVVDFGHRAIHEMTVQAKAIVTAYYGKSAQRAYFNGCSNGGRQALISAQRYPDDYDGIVAGAPAGDPAGGLAAWAYMEQGLAQPGAYVPLEKMTLITDAVMQQCDALDGVKDGVLENPRACPFRIESLQCDDPVRCFTPAQIAALKRIYDGPSGEYAGRRYRGYVPGGEAGNWIDFVGKKQGASGHSVFLVPYLRYFVHQDPDWDMSHFDFASDRKALEDVLGPPLGATNPDLSAFAAHGGKLIIYQGWNDSAIPAEMTIDYYEAVRAKLGAAADDMIRLYMAPGMKHCADGEGPSDIEQMFPGGDPARSVNGALERWVETGIKPGPLVAVKYDNAVKALFAPEQAKVLRTRPLCPYPQVARYKGQGSTDEAANFGCASP